MMRRMLLRAGKANREGKPLPGLAPKEQHVRSCSIELPKEVKFNEGAHDGLFRPIGTEPVTV